MDYNTRNEMKHQLDRFDRIAAQIEELKNAQRDLGSSSRWNFCVVSQRDSSVKMFSSNMSDESELKIRQILQEEIEVKLIELQKELESL